MRGRDVVVAIFAFLLLLLLTIAYWKCPSANRHEIYEFAVIVGGILGIVFAYWRCRTADDNLNHERFRVGSEMLKMDGPYAARVEGAAILSGLAKKDPSRYDVTVMKTFEAYLAFPPAYGSDIGAHKEGEVDFMSSDIVEVVRTINARIPRQRRRYKLDLPGFAPFLVLEDGKVGANPDHAGYKKWMEVERKAPEY